MPLSEAEKKEYTDAINEILDEIVQKVKNPSKILNNLINPASGFKYPDEIDLEVDTLSKFLKEPGDYEFVNPQEFRDLIINIIKARIELLQKTENSIKFFDQPKTQGFVIIQTSNPVIK